MAWRRLTKEQWAAICIHLPQAKSPKGVDARALMIGAVLSAFCGSAGRPRNVTMDAWGFLSPGQYQTTGNSALRFSEPLMTQA
jgi:hypothetical protein